MNEILEKIFLSSLLSLIFFSCSVSAPDTSSSSLLTAHSSLNFSDLEKEYKSFSTKALSDAYVSRMFNKFLVTTPNPTQVIRQLEFARYLKDVKSDSNYFDSLKTFIGGDIAKFNLINNTSGVPQKKTTEPTTFGVFVDSLNPNFNNIVTSGLILNLDAGNVASYPGNGTLWNDLSGNGNNGTLINGPIFNSAYGGSLVFDGVNDYVECGNINYNRNTFSVFSWFKLPVVHSNWNVGVITKWVTSNTSNNEWWLGLSNATGPSPITGGIQLSNASYINSLDTVNYTTNIWYNVGFTFDNGTLKLYKNGILVSTSTSPVTSVDTKSITVKIGSFGGYGFSNYYTNLNLSIAQIYNKALSSSEVEQNYNALKGRYGL